MYRYVGSEEGNDKKMSMPASFEHLTNELKRVVAEPNKAVLSLLAPRAQQVAVLRSLNRLRGEMDAAARPSSRAPISSLRHPSDGSSGGSMLPPRRVFVWFADKRALSSSFEEESARRFYAVMQREGAYGETIHMYGRGTEREERGREGRERRERRMIKFYEWLGGWVVGWKVGKVG